jgi:hypothetical protein
MRMLFWPNRIGLHLSKNAIAHKHGMPLGVGSSLRDIDHEIDVVSRNPGNMVHVEAPAKTFAVDRTRSSYYSWELPGRERDAAAKPAKVLNENFDAVTYSFANIIKDYYKPGSERELATQTRTWRKMLDFLRHLDMRIYVFGIGMQDELPEEKSSIPPTLFDLLSTFNERASLFGVRGPSTAHWMHAIGLRNATPLGCPSLYVYPRNVLAVTAPALTAESRIGSAGRLQRGPKVVERLEPLLRIAEAIGTDYVFQNDFFALTRDATDRGIYDEATGRLDGAFIRRLTLERMGFASPFRDHYLFRDTSRWRMFSAMRDAYVGDRFHGGVTFLQVGKPALILQADARVRELTGFLGIPTLTVPDLHRGSVLEAVTRALSPETIGHFHATYRKRLADYVEICEAAGLRFADRHAVSVALGHSPVAALSAA